MQKNSHEPDVLTFLGTSGAQGFVVWDSDHNLVSWSQLCPDFWYKPVDFLRPGMPMIELLEHIARKGGFGEGDPTALAKRELDRVHNAGPDSADEFQLLDGRVIFVLRNSMTGGSHASTYPDVTGRAQAEARLRNSLEQYRQAAQMVRLGHWLWDEIDQQFISCSEEFARIHGVTVEEMIAQSSGVEEPIEWIYPADRDEYENAIKGPVSYDIEYRIVTRGGDIRYMREIGQPEFDENGTFIQSRGTVQDLTDYRLVEIVLEESENRYRDLFDHTPISVWVEDWSAAKRAIDGLRNLNIEDYQAYFRDERAFTEKVAKETVLTDVNETTLRIYRVPSREEFWSFATTDFMTEDGFLMFADALAAFAHGDDQHVGAGWEKVFDGEYIYIHNTVFVPDEFRDSWARVIHATEDISVQKRMDEALNTALADAEQASRAKSDFLAHMSHELRTPLNAITGFTQLMASEIYGPHGHPKYREYSKDVLGSGQHLLSLINDILDLSKIEAGEVTFSPAEFSLHEAITECINLVSIQAPDQIGRFRTQLSDHVSSLYADNRVLRQILLNLLSNAHRFTPDGGTITVTTDLDAENQVKIAVIDTGVGIAEEDVTRVLDPFVQARSTTGTTHVGTGLGLPLSEKLMTLHGGTLELHSELHVGTTVTITFPPPVPAPK